MYLFTNVKGDQVVDLVTDPEWLGERALKHRETLERETGKKIISWAHMGGYNPEVESK